MAIRSGRFTSKDATRGIRIIQGYSGAFYRILNSGEVDFAVTSGVSSVTTVESRSSIDVAVSRYIEIETTKPGEIEGIYEYLETSRSVRSGRFKKNMNMDARHKIIDLRSKADRHKKHVLYRIFNSGSNDFELLVGTDAAVMVQPDQSFDFELPESVKERRIYVKTVADNKQIDGIYDYLGEG